MSTSTKRSRAVELSVPHFTQPDDTTCGPTCLQKIYAYFGIDASFETILQETEQTEGGGTLAVFLGIAALKRGLRARIRSYNLRVFDPTWWNLPPDVLAERLERRADAVRSRKLRQATVAYREFALLGGDLAFGELTPPVLTTALDRGHPVLTGLSSTYLYRDMRERPDDMKEDDIRGEPTGHFVVIAGYRKDGEEFLIRDPFPYTNSPLDAARWFRWERLLHAILLGVLTYDAVLLEIWSEAERD